MKNLILIVIAIAAASSALATAEKPDRQQRTFPRFQDEIIHGGNAHLAKSAGDTIVLMGPWGSGALYNGQFETPTGAPAWNGWTTRDYTEPQGDGYWHVSDYNAATLGGHGEGNLAAYCGDETIASCGPEDPEGGYGNSWNEAIQWTATVADPAQPCLVQLEAWLNQDTEPAYDFCYVSIKGPEFEPADVWESDGILENYHLALEFTVQPEEYTGPAGDQIVLQIRFTSDGAWSDADCLHPTQGAIQIDDISVTLNSGAYQTFDDFQEGLGNWEIHQRPGVGDFARIWTGLDDRDPCATNYSPQVAFIDDGQVVPGTGGTTCIDWCYGPGGYISNQSGGLAGPDYHLDSMILSPVIPWPGPEYQGCRFDLDRYEHEPLAADSPGIGSLWLFRSTGSPDPADIELAYWMDRDSGIRYGGPRYFRDQRGVSDFLEPDCQFIQLRLGAWEWGWWWDWIGENGTPAPYFDNVRIIAYKFHGPGLSLWDLNRAADGFPASGQLDLENLGTNSVRFDAIRDVAYSSDPRIDPGDSLFCYIAPIRTGAELDGTPRLHYKLFTNPVFDPYRSSGLPNEGSVEGWRPLYPDGDPNLNGFAFDLPDTGFFFPGDVIHYFISATDQVPGEEPQTSYLPADTTGFSQLDERDVYSPQFTVRALPTVSASLEVPGMLIWDRLADPDWNRWQQTLIALGLEQAVDYDLYRSRYADNTLAARATLDQVAPYQTLVFTCGDYYEDILGTQDNEYFKADDIALLDQWLQLGQRNALFTGNHLIKDLFVQPSSRPFLANWIGAEYYQADVRPLIGDPLSPLVLADEANPVIAGADRWYVQAECPSPSGLTAAQGLPSAQRLAGFADLQGGPSYPYAAAILSSVPEHQANVVTLPYDLAYVLDAPGSKDSAPLSARARILADILTYFGVPFTPEQISDVPPLGPLTVTSYPNPFNPRTRVDFHLPQAGRVSLKVFNVRGELVRTLLDESRPSGPGQVFWEGQDDQGSAVASGLYFYEFRALNQVKVGKMTLVR